MKLIALALNLYKVYDPTPFFITDIKNNKLKVFTTQKQAEKYISKYYDENVVFIGTIVDTTKLHRELITFKLKEIKK